MVNRFVGTILLICVFSVHALSKNEGALIEAAKKGDAKEIHRILKRFNKNKDSIDARRAESREENGTITEGFPALFEAVRQGSGDSVRALIIAGAEVDYVTPDSGDGRYCILLFAGSAEVLDLLLEAGAPPKRCEDMVNNFDLREDRAEQILAGLIKARTVQRLIKEGFNPNVKSSNGKKSLLYFAVNVVNSDLVATLTATART